MEAPTIRGFDVVHEAVHHTQQQLDCRVVATSMEVCFRALDEGRPDTELRKPTQAPYQCAQLVRVAIEVNQGALRVLPREQDQALRE